MFWLAILSLSCRSEAGSVSCPGHPSLDLTAILDHLQQDFPLKAIGSPARYGKNNLDELLTREESEPIRPTLVQAVEGTYEFYDQAGQPFVLRILDLGCEESARKTYNRWTQEVRSPLLLGDQGTSSHNTLVFLRGQILVQISAGQCNSSLMKQMLLLAARLDALLLAPPSAPLSSALSTTPISD